VKRLIAFLRSLIEPTQSEKRLLVELRSMTLEGGTR
jgi:hypothetical protein